LPKSTLKRNLGHQEVHAGEVAEDGVHFLFGEDSREAFGPFGPGDMDFIVNRLFEHFAVEEEEGAEGLVLGAGSHLLLCGQVSEEGFDFRCSHILGVAFVVEEDVAFDSVDVGLFGAVGIMLAAQGMAHLVQQFWGRWAGESL
jgi:hypothetical protein